MNKSSLKNLVPCAAKREGRSQAAQTGGTSVIASDLNCGHCPFVKEASMDRWAGFVLPLFVCGRFQDSERRPPPSTDKPIAVGVIQILPTGRTSNPHPIVSDTTLSPLEDCLASAFIGQFSASRVPGHGATGVVRSRCGVWVCRNKRGS